MPRHLRAPRVLPAIDERLVMPGSGIEILDGEVLKVPGADPPHARGHAALAYVLGAHTARGFVAVVDMLTRTSEDSDFAPDASIYPEGPDPDTGGRRLEVIAFEVVSKQRLAVPTKKARELARRGVRRVLALVLAKERVLEWDRRLGRWRPMHRDEVIEDVCLEPALPVRVLLDTAGADAAVLAAIEARRPELVERLRAAAEARGEARGEARAREVERTRLAASVRAALAALGVTPGPAGERVLTHGTLEELHGLLAGAIRER